MFKIEDLYMEYKQDIYHYLLSLTHNPHLSEDLLSETFVRAIRSLATFKQNSTVKTWLFGIARNVWLQHLRTIKSDKPDNLAGMYISETTEDAFLTRDLAAKIEALLSTRDQRSQTVVQMRMEGQPYGVIAQGLGITESSARVIDFRTKKWLKTSLEKEGLLP